MAKLASMAQVFLRLPAIPSRQIRLGCRCRGWRSGPGDFRGSRRKPDTSSLGRVSDEGNVGCRLRAVGEGPFVDGGVRKIAELGLSTSERHAITACGALACGRQKKAGNFCRKRGKILASICRPITMCSSLFGEGRCIIHDGKVWAGPLGPVQRRCDKLFDNRIRTATCCVHRVFSEALRRLVAFVCVGDFEDRRRMRPS